MHKNSPLTVALAMVLSTNVTGLSLSSLAEGSSQSIKTTSNQPDLGAAQSVSQMQACDYEEDWDDLQFTGNVRNFCRYDSRFFDQSTAYYTCEEVGWYPGDNFPGDTWCDEDGKYYYYQRHNPNKTFDDDGSQCNSAVDEADEWYYCAPLINRWICRPDLIDTWKGGFYCTREGAWTMFPFAPQVQNPNPHPKDLKPTSIAKYEELVINLSKGSSGNL